MLSRLLHLGFGRRILGLSYLYLYMYVHIFSGIMTEFDISTTVKPGWRVMVFGLSHGYLTTQISTHRVYLGNVKR